MTRDNNPDRLDDGARAEAEMKEREALGEPKQKFEDTFSGETAVLKHYMEDGANKAYASDKAVADMLSALPAPQGDDGLVGEIIKKLEAKRVQVHDLSGVGYETDPDCAIAIAALRAQAAEIERWAKNALDNDDSRIAAEAEIAGLKVEYASLNEMYQTQGLEAFKPWKEQKARAEAAEAKLASAMEALEPFAVYAETLDSCYPTPHGGELEVTAKICSPDDLRQMIAITLADCRRARTTLSSLKGSAE